MLSLDGHDMAPANNRYVLVQRRMPTPIVYLRYNQLQWLKDYG